MKAWTIYWLFVCTSIAHSQSLITRTFPIHNIQTETAKTQLLPHLHHSEKIYASTNALIITANPETLSTINTILASLDVKPVSLKIKLHYGDIGSLDNRVIQYKSNSKTIFDRDFTVLNGHQFILKEEQIDPVLSTFSNGLLAGVSFKQHTASNSIVIKPQLQGAQVQLKIYQSDENKHLVGFQKYSKQVLVSTTVIPLNQWKLLSGHAHNSWNANQLMTSKVKPALFIRFSID